MLFSLYYRKPHIERIDTMDARIVDNLPPVIRGAGSPENEERMRLTEWLEDGNAHMVADVEDRKAHNRLQQKIRNIAKKKGINVTVRYYPESKETGFQGMNAQETVVKKASRKTVAHSE